MHSGKRQRDHRDLIEERRGLRKILESVATVALPPEVYRFEIPSHLLFVGSR